MGFLEEQLKEVIEIRFNTLCVHTGLKMSFSVPQMETSNAIPKIHVYEWYMSTVNTNKCCP